MSNDMTTSEREAEETWEMLLRADFPPRRAHLMGQTIEALEEVIAAYGVPLSTAQWRRAARRLGVSALQFARARRWCLHDNDGIVVMLLAAIPRQLAYLEHPETWEQTLRHTCPPRQARLMAQAMDGFDEVVAEQGDGMSTAQWRRAARRHGLWGLGFYRAMRWCVREGHVDPDEAALTWLERLLLAGVPQPGKPQPVVEAA
jgi:hypothetical protein